jgi:uncharacterized protein YjbJ (UPF0337 family)
VKEVVGKVTDSKLEGEGKADQFKGKVQNAVGGLKDTLRASDPTSRGRDLGAFHGARGRQIASAALFEDKRQSAAN